MSDQDDIYTDEDLNSILAKYGKVKRPTLAPPRRSKYDPLIEKHAAKYGVDPDLVRRVIRQESSGNPNARSPKNAQGLMQLIPDTARAMGVTDPYDPDQNIMGGVKYLRKQLDTFGDPKLALAAYNAGPGRVKQYKGIPPFKETRDYVSKIGKGYTGTGYSAQPQATETPETAQSDGYSESDLDSIISKYQPAKPGGQPTLTPPTPLVPPKQFVTPSYVGRQRRIGDESVAPTVNEAVTSSFTPGQAQLVAPGTRLNKPAKPSDKLSLAAQPESVTASFIPGEMYLQSAKPGEIRGERERVSSAPARKAARKEAERQRRIYNAKLAAYQKAVSIAQGQPAPSPELTIEERMAAGESLASIGTGVAEGRYSQARSAPVQLVPPTRPKPPAEINLPRGDRDFRNIGPRIAGQQYALKTAKTVGEAAAAGDPGAQQILAEGEREKRVAKMGWGEYLAQTPKSPFVGLAQGAEASLKGIAALAKVMGQEGDTRQFGTYRLGEYILENTRKIVGSNPDLEQEFFVGKSPSAIGQMAGLLLGGWVSKTPKLAVAVLAGNQVAGDVYDEVRNAGGSDKDAAFSALIAGGLLGPTELIGMRGAMNAVKGTLKAQTWNQAIKLAIKEGRRDVVENVLQEMGQEWAQGQITGQKRTAAQIAEAGALGGIASAGVTPSLTLVRVRPTTGPKGVGDSIAEGKQTSPTSTVEAQKPQSYRHAEFGEVTASENQSGVPSGKVRVEEVGNPDATHVIQRPNGRGEGNRLAVPVRTKGESNVSTPVRVVSDAGVPQGTSQGTTAAKEYGGRSEQGGGRLEEAAPTGMVVAPVPESPETLNAQVDAMQEGRRPAVLVTEGEQTPIVPKGFTETQTKVGKFIHPDSIKPEEIKQSVADDTYAQKYLGIVNPAADTQSGAAVIARDAETGKEIQAAAVETPQEAVAQAQEFAKQHPQAVIEPTTAEQVKAERQGKVIKLDEPPPADVVRILNRTMNQTVGPDIPAEVRNGTTQDLIDFFATIGLSDEIVNQSSIALRKAGYTQIGDVLITDEGLKAAPKQLPAKAERLPQLQGEEIATAENIERYEAQERRGKQLLAKNEMRRASDQLEASIKREGQLVPPKKLGKEAKELSIQTTKSRKGTVPLSREAARPALEQSAIIVPHDEYLKAKSMAKGDVDAEALLAPMKDRMTAALAEGRKVELVLPEENKRINVVKMVNGMAEDAKGQRWGLGALLFPKKGYPKSAIEISAPQVVPPKLTPPTKGETHARTAQPEGKTSGRTRKAVGTEKREVTKGSGKNRVGGGELAEGRQEGKVTLLIPKGKPTSVPVENPEVFGDPEIHAPVQRQVRRVMADPISPATDSLADVDAAHAMALSQMDTRMSMSPDPELGFEKGKVRSTDVIKSYANVLESQGKKVPIRVGRMGIRGARGVYVPTKEVIRLKTANNIPTAAHEIGHALQRILFGSMKAGALKPVGSQAIRELVGLGRALYGTQKPSGGYRVEGFAEFMRHYLTGDAATAAPAMNRYFTQTFLPAHPELQGPLKAAREQTDTYRKQGAENRAKANLVQSTFGQRAYEARQKLTQLAERLPTDWVDELTPLMRLSAEAERLIGTPLSPGKDPYQIGGFQRGRSHAVTEEMAERGMVDIAGNRVGPPLRDATAIVGRKNERKFALYLWARHALDMIEDGKEPGITKQDAELLIAKYSTPEIQLAAQKLYDWRKGVLEYVRQSSPDLSDAIDKMLAKWPHSVPVKRYFAPGEMKSGKGGQGGALTRLKGSGRLVKDIFPQIVSDTERLLGMAHKRQVLNAIVSLSKVEGMGYLIEEVPIERVPQSTTIEQIKKQLEDLGVDASGADLDDVITFFTPSQTPKGTDPIIPIKGNDGKMRWYQVPSELYSTLSGLDIYRLPKAVDIIFGIPNRALRLGTTGLRASFSLVTNPLRDIPTFMLQTKSHKNMAQLSGHLMSAFQQAFDPRRIAGKTGKDLDLFFRLGAQMAQPLGLDTQATRRTSKNLFRGKTFRVITSPVNTLRDIFSLPESIPRVAEIRAVMSERGLKPDDMLSFDDAVALGLAAKQVTVDFSAGGKYGKVANQVTTFFNASVQGNRSFIRRAFREKDPVLRRRAWIRGLLYMAIPTLLLWWKNKDDEWYKDMDAKDKARFWHIAVPGTDQVLQIPRSQEWGSLFAAIPEMTFDSLYRKDPEEFKSTFGYVFDTVTPPLTPTTMKVAQEQWKNRIDYFEKPIVPKAEEDLSPEEQYGPYSSLPARVIGKAVTRTFGSTSQVSKYFGSPRRIDQMIRSLGGGVGADLADAPRAVKQAIGKGDREFEMADAPVVGRVFLRGGKEAVGTVKLEKFYEELQKSRQRELSKDSPETNDEAYNRVRLETAAKVMTGLRQQVRDLKDNAQRRLLNREMATIADDLLAGRDPKYVIHPTDSEKLKEAKTSAMRLPSRKGYEARVLAREDKEKKEAAKSDEVKERERKKADRIQKLKQRKLENKYLTPKPPTSAILEGQ